MHRSSHTLVKNKSEGRVGGSSCGPGVVFHDSPAAAAFDGALCLASCHGEEVSSAAAAHDCALGLAELHSV